MLIRTTNLGTNDAMLQQILSKQAALAKAQNQLLTGKKLTKPSDNPVDTSQVLTLKKQQNNVKTYINNIKNAREQLNMVDKTLEQTVEQAQTAYDLAIQASNGINSTEQLKAIKANIDMIKESIVDMANSQYGEQFLYSGANTTYKPFIIESDGSITYNGSKDSDSMSRCVEIMDEVFIPLSINGEEVFGSYDATTSPPTAKGILGALSELSIALDQDPPDFEQISSYLAPLKQGLNQVIQARTEIAGHSGVKLDMTESYLSSLSISLVERISNKEEIDLFEAATNLTKTTYALEASLASFSSNMSLSLLNYL